MIFASLIAKLGFDTAQWDAGKGKAIAGLRDYEKTQTSTLKNIKDAFGKGSELGQLTKLLAGGGAVAGASMAGKEVAELAHDFREITEASRQGGQAYADAVEKFGSSIPLLGKINDAMKDFVVAIDDVQARALHESQTAVDAQNAINKQAKLLKQMGAAASDAKADLSRLNDEMAEQTKLVGMAEGPAKKIEVAWSSFYKDQQNIVDKTNAALRSAKADAITIQDLQSQINDPKSHGIYSDEAGQFKLRLLKEQLKAATDISMELNDAETESFIAAEKKRQAEIQVIKVDAATESAKKVAEITKKLNDDIKEQYISALEDEAKAVEERIKDQTKKHDPVHVEQIRGQVGIVTQNTNPDTAILKESRDELKKINKAIEKQRADKSDDGISFAM